MTAILIFVEAVILSLGIYGFWLGKRLKSEDEWEECGKA